MTGTTEETTGYEIETEENRIIINGELALEVLVNVGPVADPVAPTNYEWLDEGAWSLQDRESEVEVQFVAGMIGETDADERDEPYIGHCVDCGAKHEVDPELVGYCMCGGEIQPEDDDE